MLSLCFRLKNINAQTIYCQKRRLGYTYKVKVILLRSQFLDMLLNLSSMQVKQ